MDTGLSALLPYPWSRQVPGTLKEVLREPGAATLLALLLAERGGRPASGCMALKGTCLFCALVSSPHAGAHSN